MRRCSGFNREPSRGRALAGQIVRSRTNATEAEHHVRAGKRLRQRLGNQVTLIRNCAHPRQLQSTLFKPRNHGGQMGVLLAAVQQLVTDENEAKTGYWCAFSDSDPVVLILTIGFILLFVGASIFNSEGVASVIGAGFTWTAKYLGSFFQLLLLATFFIALGTAASKAGNAKIGGLEKPEISRFRWLSMIMCTLLAGGGVFFAAGEPVYHFVVTPPAFNTEAGTAAAVAPALAQSFTHWGFLAWAVLGSLTALVLARAHFPRSNGTGNDPGGCGTGSGCHHRRFHELCHRHGRRGP
jgi:hypothetical protein